MRGLARHRSLLTRLAAAVLALAVQLLLAEAPALARPDGDPSWDDLPEGDHNFMFDKHMDPHWRREHLPDKAAVLEARKRAAAEKRKTRAKAKAAKPRPPAPHPAP